MRYFYLAASVSYYNIARIAANIAIAALMRSSSLVRYPHSRTPSQRNRYVGTACTHYVCVASRRCALGRDQTRGQWRPWQNCAASPVSRRAKLSQRRATCCVTVWPDASPHTAVLGHTGEYWRILADTALVLPTYCDTPRPDIPKYDAVHQHPYCRRRLAYLRTS